MAPEVVICEPLAPITTPFRVLAKTPAGKGDAVSVQIVSEDYGAQGRGHLVLPAAAARDLDFDRWYFLHLSAAPAGWQPGADDPAFTGGGR